MCDRFIRFFTTALTLLMSTAAPAADQNGAAPTGNHSSATPSGLIEAVRSSLNREAPSAAETLEVTERLLGRIPTEMQFPDSTQRRDQKAHWRAVEKVGRLWTDQFRVSPDQRRVFLVAQREGRAMVMIDGTPGPAYDEVSSPCFSPDSRRIAYSARRENSMFLVVDGVEGKGFEPWSGMYPIFSPDSKRVAFMARRDGRERMVIDGIEGRSYKRLGREIPPRVFSPDSKRSAYEAEVSPGKWVAVVDGAEGPEVDAIKNLHFSPDSRRVSYEARRGGSCFAVVDGVEGPVLEGVTDFIGVGREFSPDSQRVFHLAWCKNGRDMVVEGRSGKPYDHVELSSLVFSPDSSRLVFGAKTGETACVVDEGQEGPGYDGIEEMPLFSPDGGHLAYAASRAGGTFIVLDGVEGASYGDISHCVFSPDSSHLAYAALRGLSAVVVRDGREGPRHLLGEIAGSRLRIVFSPDSQRLAYGVGIAGHAHRVVVDGVESQLYGLLDARSLTFSPDSKHVAYCAAPFTGGWRVVVDGRSSNAYTGFVNNTWPIFDGPDSLHVLAIRDDEILLLQIKAPATKAVPTKTGSE